MKFIYLVGCITIGTIVADVIKVTVETVNEVRNLRREFNDHVNTEEKEG